VPKRKEYKETIFIECECGDPQDSVILHRFIAHKEEKWEPELYMDSFLVTYDSFWKRLRHATRYLLGRTPRKYGFFGCTLIGRDDAAKMVEVLDVFIGEYDEWEKNNTEKD
jgi:hypothetical protein